MFYVILAGLFSIFGVFGVKQIPNIGTMERTAIRVACGLLAALMIAMTSFVYIGDNEVGQLSRIYGGQLPPGHIIAVNGQKGPQAEILGPGFNFRLLLNVLNKVEKEKVVEVPSGQYAKLTAKDGAPLKPGQTFADSFDDKINQMLDAKFFLENGGQRGQQITVLTPAKYRLNRYLWDVQFDKDYDIEKGFVGVVKSNARSAVNFGNLSAKSPDDCTPTIEKDLSGGKLAVPLVPVGCIGVWEHPLLPGRYYINQDVYQIVKMDTRVQTWEFKGGYTRRAFALSVDAQGKIDTKESIIEEPYKPEYADRAVFLKVEGWDIPQELRVLVQVAPDKAPIVVASVGGEKEVEDRIIIPVVRAIVRDVTGGGTITVSEQNSKGEFVDVIRPPSVLDLLNNRAVLERAILNVIKPEGEKAGVEIKEVRFGNPAIPPELLVARLRQQLAQQLSASYQQEQMAQMDRIKSENARATADQQGDLVKAQIELQRAQQTKLSAELIGQGEKAKLTAIAAGQKEQRDVLGPEKVVELRKFEVVTERFFNMIEKNPEIVVEALKNAGKLVPNTLITTGGGGSINDAAAIFGTLFGNNKPTKSNPEK